MDTNSDDDETNRPINHWYEALGSEVPTSRRERAYGEAGAMGLDSVSAAWIDEIAEAIEADMPETALERARQRLDFTGAWRLVVPLCIPDEAYNEGAPAEDDAPPEAATRPEAILRGRVAELPGYGLHWRIDGFGTRHDGDRPAVDMTPVAHLVADGSGFVGKFFEELNARDDLEPVAVGVHYTENSDVPECPVVGVGFSESFAEGRHEVQQ